MTKRNGRTRRHGTNEMAADGRKGRVSPTASGAENVEYTMIDLVRSVERLHFCKSGDRKDTVMWSDVKKHYKKTTGRVLSTEAFNKLAGVTGASRKDLIAGPLAGLLVAEDPAALVLRFKYDANKGDPLINHRYYLEASGAKTTVHHAPDALSPRRLADVTNTGNASTVSPSRSETSSASLSPTCLSQISTDPDTEALSPVSTSSPLSSAPLSPDTREYVTANDEQPTGGDQSFNTARTSPMTSDWETSSSSRDTATPDGSPANYDQEKTLNILDTSHGAADETIGASEILKGMDTPVKDEVVRGEEEEKVEKIEEKEEMLEDSFEEGSDKENHLVETAALPVAKPMEATETAAAAAEDVVVSHPTAVDEAVDVPDAVQEIEVETSPHPQKDEDDVIEEQKEASEPTAGVESAEEEKRDVKEEEDVKKEEEGEEREERQEMEEEEHDLAAGDGPVPLQYEESAPPALPSSPVPVEKDDVIEEITTTTFSSSDETLLTVIERGPAIVPEEEAEEEKQEEQSEEREEVKEEERMEIEEEEKKDEEVVQEEKKVEEPAAGDSSAAAAAVVADSIVVDQVTEVVGESVVKEEEEVHEEEERSKRVKREATPVEEVKEVESIVAQPEEDVRKEEEVVVDTVVKTEPVVELASAAPEPVTAVTEEEATSVTEEPTTMVSAASVAPIVHVQPQQLQQTPPPPPPPPSHEPMTSDDVDMNDVLAGGPAVDVHTPSVTAPITLQPKPASRALPEEDDDSEVITHQPVVDESDAPSTTLAAVSPKDDETTAASPDDLALRRAQPAKKFPCCTIV